MCNLNIFIKSEELKGIRALNLCSFMDSAAKSSYINNSDGDGCYFSESNFIVKSAERVNYLKFQRDIALSKFILSHQRLTTHGIEEIYTQPFEDKEFVLLHNGVLAKFSRQKRSDSLGLFEDFLKTFEKERKNQASRQKAITKSISSLLNDCWGSFSIGLFDKRTQKLYYFKNSSTNINAYITDDDRELYITTKTDNTELLELYRKDYREYDFEDNKIYVISVKNKVKIKEIGTLVEPDYYYNNNQGDYMHSFRGADEDFDYSKWDKKLRKREEFQDKIREQFGFFEGGAIGYVGYCQECQEQTTNSNPNGEIICDICLFEYWKGDKNERKRAVREVDLESKARESGIELLKKIEEEEEEIGEETN